MTAEVVVMNRQAIALAADSAVTLSKHTPDQKILKIWTSAEKLFQLSEGAPVGIMFYNNSMFLGVPWETIIRIYRQRLGLKRFATLEQYAEDFLDFVRKERRLFPPRLQRDFLQSFTRSLLYRLRKSLQQALKQVQRNRAQGQLTDKDCIKAFSDIVDKQLAQAKNAKLLDGLSPRFVSTVRRKHSTDIGKGIKEVFGKMPRASTCNAKLRVLATEALCRRCLMPPATGLVFAGFGDNEHFPAMFTAGVRGMVCGRLLYDRDVTAGKGSAQIASFAQGDMVRAFMEGIHPDLEAVLQETTRTLFNKLAEVILTNVKQADAQYGRQLEKRVSPNLKALIQGFEKSFRDVRQANFANPIVEMVAHLPKDELAAMAETFVNLTKFKRRVTQEEIETVAGPIDVAVITKGEGFVWIKRKHYFQPELNPRFMARHYKEHR